MRVVGLHEDVLVCTSAIWQTTCTVVRGPAREGEGGAGREAFVVDSPVLPPELEALGALLGQVGWPCSGLLATHGDWDHLLGRLAFPDASLGVAETTAARLTGEPGAAARSLRAFDDEHYVERPRPLGLGQLQALPVPGSLEVGGGELELHPTEGHVADGMAIWIGWAKVLVCGDFLSPCEIPMLSEGGSRSAYRATLKRLAPLVEQAEHVVPGHGAVLDSARAAAILREDLAYLERLELPLARRSPEQRRIHERNLAQIAATEGEAALTGRRTRCAGVIQHVTLELRREDAPADAAFWELLGFTPVEPPEGLRGRALWLERGGTQVHLAYEPEPVVPAHGHVAVVARDYAAAIAALRAAGHPIDPRAEHWGAARAFVRSPAGHTVEVMAAPPPS